jgi:hypothetical protein
LDKKNTRKHSEADENKNIYMKESDKDEMRSVQREKYQHIKCFCNTNIVKRRDPPVLKNLVRKTQKITNAKTAS